MRLEAERLLRILDVFLIKPSSPPPIFIDVR